MSLKGKTIVVTAAASDIGAETAKVLKQRGAKVMVLIEMRSPRMQNVISQKIWQTLMALPPPKLFFSPKKF